MGDILFGMLLAAGVACVMIAGVALRLRWATRLKASVVLVAVLALTVVAVAHWRLRALGVAPRALVAVEGDAVVWRAVWSPAQRAALTVGALSPLHRARVARLLIDAGTVRTPFPPDDEADVAALRVALAARRACADIRRMDLRLGAFDRVESTPCATPEGARVAAEAALAVGDVARAWEVIAPVRGSVRDGFDARVLTLLAAPPREALDVTPTAPPGELPMWGCAMERLRQRAAGDRDPAVWDAALRGDSAACRILAATAPSRLDADSLRALLRLPPAEQRRWSAALSVARALHALSGKLPWRECLTRRVAAVDPAWLTRYPAIAATLMREARDEACAYVMDRVWFPAMTARAANDATDPTAPSLDALEDLIVGWQLVDGAWERMHPLDPRFTRARRQGLARSFHAALSPVIAWTFARLDEGYARGTPWPQGFGWASVVSVIDALPRRQGWEHESMLRAHDIPHYAVDLAHRWDLDQVRAQSHNPVLAAWVDFWRTGAYEPAHEATSSLRDARMLALVERSSLGHVEMLTPLLGAPTVANAEGVAVVAYRVSGDARPLEPWLRRAWGSIPVATRALSDWESDLRVIRTCALRLRLDGLRADVERTMARVRAARRGVDPWVLAVVEGPREAPPDDDDPE